MGRIKKRGTTGQAKNFITRTQAIRKLQISLPDFRRLCIFKGIYPREPRNKKKAAKSSTPSTTFYYTKDIQFLLHEPLLQKFRDHKALTKKIARALGKAELGDALRLEKSGVGKITLGHVVKERYPTFIDALRDLDDALSMIFLFANLPSNTTIPPKTVALCQRLSHEFQHYVITTHSLRKSFLSIKGIYYQATIQGQDIMWLVPHRFVQQMTGDVDYRIMGTFIEFYTTLLGFINFRLYNTIGLVYPPKFDAQSDEQSGELGAFKLEGRGIGSSLSTEPASRTPQIDAAAPKTQPAEDLQHKVDTIVAEVTELTEHESDDADEAGETTAEQIDDFVLTGAGADVLPQPQLSHFDAAALFAPFTFFLSRETPRQPLEFLLRSFGCKRIGWDAVLGDGAFTNSEADSTITHQVVDRPPATMAHYDVDGEGEGAAHGTGVRPGYRVPGRVYVQPQWIWDCINNAKLLRPDLYAPGATLPPHLSPWVKSRKGVYDPAAPLEDQEREGEAEAFEEEEEEAAAIEAAEQANVELSDGTNDGQSAESDSEEDEDRDTIPSIPDANDKDLVVAGEPDAEDLYQAELEAEAAGHDFAASSTQAAHLITTKIGNTKNEARKKAARRKQEEKDELQRRLGMMSRKKRVAMEKVLASQSKDDEEAEMLRKKRRRLESKTGATNRA